MHCMLRRSTVQLIIRILPINILVSLVLRLSLLKILIFPASRRLPSMIRSLRRTNLVPRVFLFSSALILVLTGALRFTQLIRSPITSLKTIILSNSWLSLREFTRWSIRILPIRILLTLLLSCFNQVLRSAMMLTLNLYLVRLSLTKMVSGYGLTRRKLVRRLTLPARR